MIYTSGTTGKPKGALRRGAGDPPQVAALLALIGYTPDDVYITTGPAVPLGSGRLHGHRAGARPDRRAAAQVRPEDWLRLVDTYKVTSTFSAPTPIRMICNLPADVKAKYDTSSMKRMIANAAPWIVRAEADVPRRLPGRLAVRGVRLDRARREHACSSRRISCASPARAASRRPMVEIKLFDDDGNEVTGTGPDHPGELFVRRPSVFADYYKQHDKFEADSGHDYHTVGDIAYRDDEGYFYICDRKKDMIISGGMNIYPAEIEAALEQHPDIYDVAVFGIPSRSGARACTRSSSCARGRRSPTPT